MDKLTDTEFPARLKAAMKNSNCPTQMLADYHCIAYESVRKWLAGATRPTPEKLRLTAIYLNVSPAWLAWGHTDADAGDKPPALMCTKLAHCDDLEFLRSTLEQLWNILDDIDTASDLAKGDHAMYRLRVEALQAKRFKLGIITDGQDLFRKEA